MSEQQKTPAWAVDFMAGWCSGGVSLVTCHPIDTVLTRLQARPMASVAVADVSASSSLTSSWTMARQVVSTAGLTSLWRGSSVLVSAVPLQNALLMGGYGIGKRWSRLVDDDNDDRNNNEDDTPKLRWRSQVSIFVAGCFGGVLQSFLMSPVELIKVHQQVHNLDKNYQQPQQQQQGRLLATGKNWRYWSRGLTATLWRDGIPHGIWFVAYDVCKSSLELQQEQFYLLSTSGHPWTIPLVSGAVAATVAWVVGYPFDLIKTRVQASACEGGNHRVLTMAQAAQELIKESPSGGFRGLYRGLGLKLTRAVPSSMIGFSTYEYLSQLLQ